MTFLVSCLRCYEDVDLAGVSKIHLGLSGLKAEKGSDRNEQALRMIAFGCWIQAIYGCSIWVLRTCCLM